MVQGLEKLGESFLKGEAEQVMGGEATGEERGVQGRGPQRWSREGNGVGQGCAEADTEPGGRDRGPRGAEAAGSAERCEARPGEGVCVGGVVRKALTGGHCFRFTSSAAK